jgi:peptidoglycan-associated lipoprotein
LKTRLSVIAAFLLITLLTGCKSNQKQDLKPQPEAPPPPVETPAPARPATEPATPLSDSLPVDVEELNRLAREKGWIEDAFFAYDSNVLSDKARAALDRSARWLKENPRVALTIGGHADERGTEQYNLALGERRGWAAREYLVTLGVSESRIAVISYGEERPFATGSNEAAWSQNRRAHLNVRLTQ